MSEIKLCKICNEPIIGDEWKHLVQKHKEILKENLHEIKVKCHKCGRTFHVKPEPTIYGFVVPLYCKKCSGKLYGFIVQPLIRILRKNGKIIGGVQDMDDMVCLFDIKMEESTT